MLVVQNVGIQIREVSKSLALWHEMVKGAAEQCFLKMYNERWRLLFIFVFKSFASHNFPRMWCEFVTKKEKKRKKEEKKKDKESWLFLFFDNLRSLDSLYSSYLYVRSKLNNYLIYVISLECEFVMFWLKWSLCHCH